MRRPVLVEAPEADRLEGAPHPRHATQLFGHHAAERALLDGFRSGALAHAWLIGGPEGIGKATLAWRFAKFLLAHPDPRAPAVVAARDLSVVDGDPEARRATALTHANLRLVRRAYDAKQKKLTTVVRVDDLREALGLFQGTSGAQGWRVCILDSADDLNASSANALLKVIEEPPPHSVFLVVAHRPGQVPVTLRSRCRKLTLAPLADTDVAGAIRSLGPPWSEVGPAHLGAAVASAGGSVRLALGLLDEGKARARGRLASLFARLPAVDWREVHALADGLVAREASDDFDILLGSTFDWLDAGVRAAAGQGRLARGAALAQAFEAIRERAREADALNLDKRALILSIFGDLAAATRA